MKPDVYFVLLSVLGVVAIGACLTGFIATVLMVFALDRELYVRGERIRWWWHALSANAPQECYTPLGQKARRVRQRSFTVTACMFAGIVLVVLLGTATTR